MPFSATPPEGLVTLSNNARTVLDKRCLVKDATGKSVEKPEDMFWRVATVVAEADRRYGVSDGAVNALAEEFYFLMTQRRFEPNSPTLMNAGRPLGQLSACFVLPVDDALSNGQSGIYDTLRSMALIHQSGGGTGFSFSRLRSRGAMVRSTTGVASGPISFMELYDASTDAVKQGGTRRGANMGILRVDHPDVLEFIKCKEDLTKITNFNISVGITTKFMAAVKADSDYELVDPVTHKVAGTLRAREVWDTMINGAWRTGEPGVFFIDEANRYNPVPHMGDYEATNPCVTGDTLVATTQGLVPIADLCASGEAMAVTLDSRFSAGKVGPAGVPFESGIKPVFRVVTKEGYAIRVTADHRFMTARGWVEAQHLEAGDALHIQNTKGGFGVRGTSEEGRVLGWLIADGHLTGDSGHGAVLGFWGEDREVAASFSRDVNEMLGLSDGSSRQTVGVVNIPSRDMATVSSTRLRALVAERYGVTAETKLDRVPAAVLAGCETMQQGFLQALFTADGHVSGTPDKGVSVRLTSVSLSLLQDVQRMLLNFGIASRIYQERHPARTVSFNGVESACQADHDLVIARDNVPRFAEEIGFLTRTKNSALIMRLASYGPRGPYRETFTARFEALVPAGEEMVYDLTEPLTHSFIGNGFVVHNCGEQPLLAYDVCNLGSVNVGHYVRNGAVDWDAMRSDIALSTHFLDNIIDVNKYPLPEIDALSKRIRRIGLGVMGFADLLVRLGIPYDSPEGVEMGRKVMEFLDVEGKKESERLAGERGAFPEWARSIWGPDETCARDPQGQRIRPMQLLRNCNVTTVAPTGTISIIAGCSSGLEPLFAVAFMRNQAGVMMPDVNEDFVAIAKAEGWYSDALMERIAKSGSVKQPEVPAKWQAVFNTANNIAPEYHIRMQAAFQQHCDSAISKTTNFGYAATVDDVRAIYEMAYDMKCKGVTVYRDGSRDNQVLSTGATQDAAAKRDDAKTAGAPDSAKADVGKEVVVLKRELGELQGTLAELQSELDRTRKALFSAEAENANRRGKRSRPEVMRGTTIRKETPLGVMFVNITEDEKGQPFEVFLNLGKAGGSAMADAEAIGRLISLALRSGISLPEIHRQLRGISSDRAVGLGPNKVLSLPDAVGIALEQWWREKQGVQTDLLSGGPASVVQGVPSAISPVPTPAAGVPITRPPMAAEQMQPQIEFGSVGGEVFMGTCPDCGSQLEFAEGCVKCHVCGFSECG